MSVPEHRRAWHVQPHTPDALVVKEQGTLVVVIHKACVVQQLNIMHVQQGVEGKVSPAEADGQLGLSLPGSVRKDP